MNLDKLKVTARKHEQREDWRKAIDVYLKVIEGYESGMSPVADLSLYNRVGDLYMKIHSTASAVQSYERAVDLYTDQGMANQAIALCGKILRVNPGRVQTYLKLARLHAEKNVVVEAKKNLLEYLERMNALGHRDDALAEVKAFADRFARNQDIRVMLSALLRAVSRDEEALEQLGKLADELETRGDEDGARRTRERMEALEGDAPALTSSGGLVFLDTGYSDIEDSSPAAGVTDDSALEIDRGRYEGEEEGVEVESVGDLEHTALDDSESAGADSLGGLLIDGATELGSAADTPDLGLTIEHTAEGDGVDQLEVDEEAIAEAEAAGSLVATPSTGLVADHTLDTGVDGVSDTAAEEEGSDEVMGMESAAAPVSAPLGFLDEQEDLGPSIEELEDRILDDPDNPVAHRTLGETLIAAGDHDRGIGELELALEQYENRADWGHASDVVAELLRLDPNAIPRYQKRVELAFRSGEKTRLIEAYLALGDVLVRVGALEKATAVYGRVLEHDPENTLAQAALQALEPAPAGLQAPPAAPRPARDFVDLGQMVLETDGPRDARIRIDRGEPTGDEEQDFAEILQHFKRGVEETIEVEDFQAHYDLGIAFKEMGLLDEAIAEFQKALRAPEGRLRTSEALGLSFYEKAQFAVAEAILKRAVDALPGQDDEKIGLLYWLGRAREEQSKNPEALRCYERALAVDIKFKDVAERISRLTSGTQ